MPRIAAYPRWSSYTLDLALGAQPVEDLKHLLGDVLELIPPKEGYSHHGRVSPLVRVEAIGLRRPAEYLKSMALPSIPAGRPADVAQAQPCVPSLTTAMVLPGRAHTPFPVGMDVHAGRRHRNTSDLQVIEDPLRPGRLIFPVARGEASGLPPRACALDKIVYAHGMSGRTDVVTCSTDQLLTLLSVADHVAQTLRPGTSSIWR